MKPYKSYDTYLIKSLKNPVEAAAYLNAALDENDPAVFLVAFHNVAQAHGIKKIADAARLHRVSLNKMLSKKGNPELILQRRFWVSKVVTPAKAGMTAKNVAVVL